MLLVPAIPNDVNLHACMLPRIADARCWRWHPVGMACQHKRSLITAPTQQLYGGHCRCALMCQAMPVYCTIAALRPWPASPCYVCIMLCKPGTLSVWREAINAVLHTWVAHPASAQALQSVVLPQPPWLCHTISEGRPHVGSAGTCVGEEGKRQLQQKQRLWDLINH